MTFDFKDKTAQEITDAVLSIVYKGAGVNDMRSAFDGLKNVTPSVRHEVLDAVEDRLISQARQDGKAWAKMMADENSAPDRFQYAKERWELLNELKRLEPMTQAFLKIADLKGNESRVWTKALIATCANASSTGYQDAATCLADIYADVSEDKNISLRQAAADKQAVATAHNAAIAKQQKLNKSAAAHKLRIAKNTSPPLTEAR